MGGEECSRSITTGFLKEPQFLDPSAGAALTTHSQAGASLFYRQNTEVQREVNWPKAIWLLVVEG